MSLSNLVQSILRHPSILTKLKNIFNPKLQVYCTLLSCSNETKTFVFATARIFWLWSRSHKHNFLPFISYRFGGQNFKRLVTWNNGPENCKKFVSYKLKFSLSLTSLTYNYWHHTDMLKSGESGRTFLATFFVCYILKRQTQTFTFLQ